jgi:hypothetical protein
VKKGREDEFVNLVKPTAGVQQKLIRHADIRTTMQYGEAFAHNMAEAHGKVVRLATNGAQGKLSY